MKKPNNTLIPFRKKQDCYYYLLVISDQQNIAILSNKLALLLSLLKWKCVFKYLHILETYIHNSPTAEHV